MIARFFFSATLCTGWLRFFRMGTGLVLLLSAVQLWPDFASLYGRSSLVDHRLFHFDDRPLAPLSDPVGHGHLAVYILLCLFLIAGLFSRWAAIGLCILHHHIFLAHAAFSYGFDYIAASALFYCIFFPIGQPHSRWVTPSLRVLQLHLCMIYFFGGFEKLLGPTWRDGTALWKALHLPDLMGALRPDLRFLESFPAVVATMGWMVIILELGYAAAIWSRAVRPLWLYGIIAMHTGIALLMGLYHFSALMILLNLAAFYFPYRKDRNITEQIVNKHQSPHAARPRLRRKDPPKQPMVPAPNR